MTFTRPSTSSAWLTLAVSLMAVMLAVTHTSPALADSVETAKVTADELTAYRQAAAYSRAHRGLSMVVMKNDEIVFEDYPGSHSANEAHNLYSGTKSFTCAMAVAAIQDKLLRFDEPVAQIITEWRTDPQKSKITIRQLLTLTSGLDAGKTGKVPTYAAALNAPMLHPPGTTFQYGPFPFQVFGEVMRRQLVASGETTHGYLMRRVLAPIGLHVSSWRTTTDGNVKMPAGMFLTAREWAKYGQLILDGGQWAGKSILNIDLLAECFHGTAANPGYGISFWLPVNGGLNSKGQSADPTATRLNATAVPGSIIKAAGVGGQRLYVIPSSHLVIVRQSSRRPLWGWGFQDTKFLAPILRNAISGSENGG